jgi:hypothetical protein
MNKLIFKILLLGGSFFYGISSFSAKTKSETFLTDKFVFKVANEVFTVNNLKAYYNSLQNLKCIYPETLLYNVFKSEFNLANNKWYFVSPEFNEEQKQYFNSIIKFGKLLVYSRSYDVVVKKSLKKYFYLSATKLKCDLSAFERNKDLTPSFNEILRLEIFMRSRFLPTERQGKSTKSDIEKAVKSSKDLIKSIDKQIDQEVYW